MTASPSRWVLIGISGAARDREFVLVGDEIHLGRTEDNDIAVADGNVSRHHANLLRRGDAWGVKDLGSKNGTLVNGRRVTEAELRAGDILRTGEAEFRMELESRPRARELAEAVDRSERLRALLAGARRGLPALAGFAARLRRAGRGRLLLYGTGLLLAAALAVSFLTRRPTPRRGEAPAAESAGLPPQAPIRSSGASEEELLSWRSQAEVALARDDLLAAIPLFRKVAAARPLDDAARARLSRAEGRLSQLIKKYYEDGARQYEKLYFDEAIREWRKVLALSKNFDAETHRKTEERIREARARLAGK